MKYSIIGDVHNCAEELIKLLKKLGYTLDQDYNIVSKPEDNTLIFLGDIINKGPFPIEAIKIVRKAVKAGHALAVIGNHEKNYLMYLNGKLEDPKQYVSWTADEISNAGDKFKNKFIKFIKKLPYHYSLDNGKLIVTHEIPVSDMEKAVNSILVHGHHPVDKPKLDDKNCINIDGGCVYGGKMYALQYPSMELVKVKAKKEYFKKD